MFYSKGIIVFQYTEKMDWCMAFHHIEDWIIRTTFSPRQKRAGNHLKEGQSSQQLRGKKGCFWLTNAREVDETEWKKIKVNNTLCSGLTFHTFFASKKSLNLKTNIHIYTNKILNKNDSTVNRVYNYFSS